jgi:hypothetical protein
MDEAVSKGVVDVVLSARRAQDPVICARADALCPADVAAIPIQQAPGAPDHALNTLADAVFSLGCTAAAARIHSFAARYALATGDVPAATWHHLRGSGDETAPACLSAVLSAPTSALDFVLDGLSEDLTSHPGVAALLSLRGAHRLLAEGDALGAAQTAANLALSCPDLALVPVAAQFALEALGRAEPGPGAAAVVTRTSVGLQRVLLTWQPQLASVRARAEELLPEVRSLLTGSLSFSVKIPT